MSLPSGEGAETRMKMAMGDRLSIPRSIHQIPHATRSRPAIRRMDLEAIRKVFGDRRQNVRRLSAPSADRPFARRPGVQGRSSAL